MNFKLRDIYIQKWHEELNRSSDTNMYKYVRTTFRQSNYINILPTQNCKSLLSFLTRNHRLPIELGRWQNIPYNERKCTSCNTLGDEYHYLMECKELTSLRKQYISKYYQSHPNFVKFIELLNSQQHDVLLNLSIFINKIIKKLHYCVFHPDLSSNFCRYFLYFSADLIHTFTNFLNILDELCVKISLKSDNRQKSCP